jgi:hypothetical protein
MKLNCPYCGIVFSLDGVSADYSFPKFEKPHLYGRSLARDEGDKTYSITSHKCPECRKQIMWLNEIRTIDKAGPPEPEIVETTLLFPKWPIRPLPPEIPEKFASDFREAYNTLAMSPKASAALSRRCLQNLIREQESIIEKTLQSEIEKLLKTNKLPKYLADDLDSIRVVGNFAAHPIKDTNTGEIVDVGPGEAEWTLEVLEELLLFYFVDTSRSKARRDALNRKLKDTGKDPMLKA